MKKGIFALLILVLTAPVALSAQTLNNLSATISPSGDVPPVVIPCTTGRNYTLSLVHRYEQEVSYSFGPVQRRYCGDEGKIYFSGFNINNPHGQAFSQVAWGYVRLPLEYIIKDTTGLPYCYTALDCPIINLSGAFNFYNHSVYLASSTYWTTVASGPSFTSSDFQDWPTISYNLQNWSNVTNGDGSVNISTTSTQVATGTAVVFFPGVMGTRLYDDSSGIETEAWASVLDSNHAKLGLDTAGKSLNDVYTKDDTQSIGDEAETGITDEIYNANIYNSFINDLRSWKVEGVIKDYAFIPYDWRLSLEDIVTSGATTTDGKLRYTNSQNFSQSYILKKLRELGSKSGNITLIGHSNGGLVIKALMQKLEDANDPLYYKINKIIFVAVPQVGTPDAVANILHGTDLGWHGLIMSNQRSRQLSENFPMAYNLLPSSSYFSTVSSGFAIDKVVTFDTQKDAYSTQISKYGFFVSNPSELKDYVLGGDARVKPAYADTNNPNIGNSSLYSNAEAVHAVLDSWQPASTTKVIQVAGWGEETLSGITETICLDKSVFGYHKCIKPKFVVDGDGTVVTPSALWMSTSTPNVERWWVDLKEFADQLSNIKRIHRDIMEVYNLRSFLKKTLLSQSFLDPENIIISSPSTLVSNKPRLHYTLHSPLTLGVMDSQGRYTGLDPVTKQVREEIPGVNYGIVGEAQFVSVPSDLVGQVKLSGYEDGVFALDVEKQQGNTVVESVSFQGLPSLTSTQVTLDISSVVASTTMNIDANGDGQTDLSLQGKLGEVVTLPKYKWQGFAQPINDTKFYPDQKVSVFKGGSTVPVKFQLKDSFGNTLQASGTPVWLAPQKGSSMSATIDESTYSDSGTVGSNFRWDPVSQQYIYNWSTKGFTPGYWYKLSVKLDDGNVYSVVVGLR